MKKVLLILLFLNALFLPFGINLPQENPEELFLSDESFKEFSLLKKEFGNRELIFASGLVEDKLMDYMDEAEKAQGEFASLSPLLKGHGVLELPPLSDVEKFRFFKEVEHKFPELTFAGEGYTNAQLAGMSLHIQQVLFPLVFALTFLSLVILTRHWATSLYLFLSSLFGVGVGLCTVRLLFGHSTILTTLTPLIGFILTLGVQLHVVYGLNHYQTLKRFFEHKLRPLLIMMITTLIGFFSLITSDLVSIRQLAISSTLSLLITWGILLIVIKIIPFEIKLNNPSLLKKDLNLPVHHPLIGWVIVLLLGTGGVAALFKMPILVEAMEFFPKEHRIHQGYEAIKKGLGGTPQFELVIKKNDNSLISLEDLRKIEAFETGLTNIDPNIKVLSVNNLIKFANQQYTGQAVLPDNEYAYEALSSKIPGSVRNHHRSTEAYRISVITAILSAKDRVVIQESLKKNLQSLDSIFTVKITGLTHLLLESQSTLVTSLVRSFLLSFVVIVFIFALFSRNIWEIFVFATLNFASILGGLFLMWVSNFTLNVSSVMTVSISMGLVVDSTVHLLYAEKLKTSKDALFQSTLIPIILAHIILFFAFGILSLENFLPIRDFALGLIMLLFTGLICDIYILPMITSKKKID